MADATASFVLTARDATGAAFASVDKNLRQFQRSLAGIRQIAGLFGVAFSGRAFTSWIAGSLQATEAVGDQRVAVEAAQKSLAEFKRASDSLAESIAVRVTPSVELLTAALDALRQTWYPTEAEALEQQIVSIQNEINRLAGGIIRFEEGGFWSRLFFDDEMIANSREEIEKLRAELEKLYAQRKNTAPKSQLITDQEVEAINNLIAEINTPKARQPLITQDELVALESFIHEMNQREPFITQDEVVALEEFIHELNTVPDRLTQEEWIDLESFIYDLNHIEKKSLDFAKSLGDDMKDAFSDWLVDGELDFKDFLKRLAAEWATSQIFMSLGSALTGKTGGIAGFFSKVFGGERAAGGPVSPGKAYLVGEKGPEMFVPNRGGQIVPNGAAGPVTVNVSNHFDVGLESVDDRIRGAAGPISHATAAAVLKALNRPSMA